MTSLRTRRTLAVVLIGALACLDPVANRTPPARASAGGPIPPSGRALRPSVSAELHVHGWSNHSASIFPASIAWQTAQTAAAGVEILWWTDHSDIYAHHLPDFVVMPTTPKQVGPRTWSVGSWDSGGGQAFVMSSGGSLTGFSEAGSRLTVSLPPGDASVTDTVVLFFGRLVQGAPRRAALTMLARPLIGDPRYQMTVWRDSTTSRYPGFRISVPLAWHPRGAAGYREVLEYVFGTAADSGVQFWGDTAVYGRPWSDADSTLVVVTAKPDAAVFTDGLDNTTDEYRSTFTVPRTGAGASVTFTLPTVTNRDSTASAQMPSAVSTAQAIGSAYGVRVLWGVELGVSDPSLTSSQWAGVKGGGAHMAVYLPYDVSPGFVETPHGTVSQTASFVASLGGVASIPHPLGTSIAEPTGTFEGNRPHVDSLAAFLARHRAWGENLLEVYAARGTMGLREHMYLVDYLLGSSVQVCPVGATDSHGQRILADPTSVEEQDNFVTWIANVTRASPVSALLASMRNCQVSFGRPFYVRGGFWIQVVTDSLGQQRLAMDTAGVSPSAQYFVFEVVVDSTATGQEPRYRKFQWPVLPGGYSLRVGGCEPAYARVEAWAGSRFLASSNVVRVGSVFASCPTPVTGRP